MGRYAYRSTIEAELRFALELAVKQLSTYAGSLNARDGGERKQFKSWHGYMQHLRYTGQLANPENLSPHTTENQTQDETNHT